MRGGTAHMLKGFDPEAVFKTIERERINFTLFVPTMIYVLLDHPALDRTDLSSLELLLYGASAMSPSRLVEGIERIGPVFSQLYGQTECYPVSVLRKADHDPKTPELFLSCGFPIAACEVKILNDQDHEVETGEPGEICVRAPHVMAEYWKRPEQTAETLKNGWLHTGDIARADERGYMFILDRKKDMIVSGGFNIFPREVEDVLSQHADVAMVAVVGVPDDKWGEAVTAIVVAREGAAERRRADQSGQGPQGIGPRAQTCEVRERIADDRRRQGRQEGAEGRVLGRPRADGRIARGLTAADRGPRRIPS
jgi:fatty-acyl-CoA synthase